MAETYRPFHLAIPVTDLASTRRFYVETLGCGVGRETDTWIDFDFYGHQLSAHVKPEETTPAKTNPVDGEDIPVRHFGVVLGQEDWERLERRLGDEQVKFLIKPTIRFKGQAGEQLTLFIQDPSGNVLEFKAFTDPDQLFATTEDKEPVE